LLRKRTKSFFLVEPAFAMTILALIFLLYLIQNNWNLLQ
jgi:hypothetical protein